MAKKYNEIQAKDNMKVDNNNEEVVEPREKRELTSVVSVAPTKVKRGLMSRLVTGVVGPDGLPGIGAYVNDEIVKPAIKNIIVDAVTSGINMVMYGDRGTPSNRMGGSRGYSPGRPVGGAGYRPNTNYASNYNRQGSEAQHPPERVASIRGSRSGVQEYLITDRFDAAHVLTALQEAADMYQVVSVADYYDLIGVPSQYTDNNYGWTIDTIVRATIVPARGGYVIQFPAVEAI